MSASFKGWLHGDRAALTALVNLLNQSEVVNGVRNSQFYPDKGGQTGKMRFEVLIEPAARFERVDPRQRDQSGYVYLLATAENGVYKIGCTKDPDNRMRTFGNLLPFEVNYLHLIETDDMRALEKGLHKRFARQRIKRSEFFALSDSQVDYIRSL